SGVGYRFVAEVEILTGDKDVATPALPRPDAGIPARPKARLRWLVVSSAAVLIVSGILFAWLWKGKLFTSVAQPQKQKNVPIRLTEDANDEGRPSQTRDGHIRLHDFFGKMPYEFIANGD